MGVKMSRAVAKKQEKKNKRELQILFILMFNYFYVYFSQTKYSSAPVSTPHLSTLFPFLFSWLTMM